MVVSMERWRGEWKEESSLRSIWRLEVDDEKRSFDQLPVVDVESGDVAVEEGCAVVVAVDAGGVLPAGEVVVGVGGGVGEGRGRDHR